MSFTSEHPLLVAPRPVRLGGASHAVFGRSHPHSAHDRLRITDSSPLDDFKLTLFSDSSSDKDSASPRSSPRSGLPSEALEEFLSILRPSFFPPTSPVLRSRRHAASLPTYPQDRSLTFQTRNRLELLSETTDISDSADIPRSQQPSRNSICHTPDSMNEDEAPLDIESDNFPFRWYKSNPLSSPISRTHTRNPFLRHASSRSPAAMSPAAIPLPQPTPDEMVDML